MKNMDLEIENKPKIEQEDVIPEEELNFFAKELIKLKNNTVELEKNIQEFSELYPRQQFYLACKLVDLKYGSFCIKIMPQRLKDEKERLGLAKKLASGIYGDIVISNIDKFELKEEESRLELARLYAKKIGFSLAKNIEKFNIQDENARLELAKALVKNDGNSLIYNIEKFNITNEKYRLNLAKSLIAKNGYELAFKIENFKIENEKDRIGIAKELILQGSNKLIVDLELERIEKRLKKAIDIRDVLYSNMLEKVCRGIDSKDNELNAEIKVCVNLVSNIRKLKEFYGQIRRDINFNMNVLLGEENAKSITKAIDDVRDKGQKEFVIETLEKMFFILSQKNIKNEITRKDELTKLIVEFITIRKPELKFYLLPMMLTSIREDKLNKIHNEIEINNKKKAYPAINAMVFDSLSLYNDDKLLTDVRKVFSKNSFLKNSKDVQDTLMALIKLGNLYLGEKETKNVVGFLVNNSNDISKNCRYIMSIIAFGNKEGLKEIDSNSNPNAMKLLFYDMYNEYISMENNEEFMKDYEKFVNLEKNVSRKFEEYLMSYVSNNKDESSLIDAIKTYLVTMTDAEKFRNERYDVGSSEHLKQLKEIDGEIYRKWSKGQKEFEELSLKKPSSSSQSTPKAIITDDAVDLFLIGTEVDNSCQHVNGLGYNKALMGYVIDGKNKAVVVKNEQGRIIARSIIRLLIDESTNEIVMAKETMYKANGIYNTINEELEKTCIEYAKWLGVSLVCGGYEDKNRYTGVLLSKGGKAPYEYVDMNYGITMGVYEIIGTNLIYLYKKGRDENGNREG